MKTLLSYYEEKFENNIDLHAMKRFKQHRMLTSVRLEGIFTLGLVTYVFPLLSDLKINS